MKKSLIIGAAMLDIVMQVDHLPEKGGDVYARSQEMTVGGCAYNVADIVKRFDVPYTLFAPIGTGFYADFIANELRQSGHESPIRTRDGDNGYCLCMVEADGERTFLTLPGVECSFQKAWFSQINPSEYDSVYVSGYEVEGEGGSAIVSFLEDNPGLTVYYAPGPRITYIPDELHQRIFALHPVLHLNEKEAVEFTGKPEYGEAAKMLYALTKNTVIVTLGSNGACVFNGEKKRIPSEKAKVIDTIGAGDSNIGAIIAMRKLGSSME
ncbi:MAG: PfkB family carbohydrate kinase, partial [Lachnospiraceae bacterium]|nr:PfkB family carbohydrate kinase [Lachnospiraceae bacterium]